MFRKSQKRRLPRVRPLSCRWCDRQTSVVADIRPGNAAAISENDRFKIGRVNAAKLLKLAVRS
jgi:hypothetical protein